MNTSIRKPYNLLAYVTTATFFLGMTLSSSASNAPLRKYENINLKQFNECIKPPSSNGSEQGWADYQGENQGKVELKVRNQPMISDGTVAATLNYKFEPSEELLTLEIKEKTSFMFGMIQASNEQIWEGFDGLVKQCRSYG
ncbi:unknown [Crocosphaera subtropica ATCC 51142]|uniref:Uncharacterized protein n=1 Tax=Crocosphaera subtropica (strain ATCC 51142 / BH68) TaxID=43989 RepID=B1WUM7_CROS5|nr:hypothetical protein [Crocosphaera subtropica]ACB50478.1 unknown [Crocosphaera subtropica ATCC 51142]